MVQMHQVTNTDGKENNNVKKIKKLSKDVKVVINVHGVKMKVFVIGGMVDGQAKGHSPSNDQRRLRKRNSRKLVIAMLSPCLATQEKG